MFASSREHVYIIFHIATAAAFTSYTGRLVYDLTLENGKISFHLSRQGSAGMKLNSKYI